MVLNQHIPVILFVAAAVFCRGRSTTWRSWGALPKWGLACDSSCIVSPQPRWSGTHSYHQVPFLEDHIVPVSKSAGSLSLEASILSAGLP